jgi:SlyX protein
VSDIAAQIIELETRLAYQEDTLAQLDAVITRQDALIIGLTQQLQLLTKRVEDTRSNTPDGELDIAQERPPHY